MIRIALDELRFYLNPNPEWLVHNGQWFSAQEHFLWLAASESDSPQIPALRI
ncbi:MAG: hypothetical protein WA621_15325 [Candidatus Acidiferrum sp.]|jgi:hypothetical protein